MTTLINIINETTKKIQPIFQALKEILFTEHSDRIFSEVNNYTANYEERSLLETVDKRAK